MPISIAEAKLHEKYSKVRNIDRHLLGSIGENVNDLGDHFTPSGFPICKSYPLCVNTNTLGDLGTGIPLYFDFYKCLILVSFILASAFAPLALLQYRTPNLKHQTTWTDKFSIYIKYMLTAGNLERGHNDSIVPMLAVLLTAIVLLLFCTYLYYRQSLLEYATEANAVHPGDYALIVKGLPSDANDEEELKLFFENTFTPPKSASIDIFNLRFNITKLPSKDKKDISSPGSPHGSSVGVLSNGNADIDTMKGNDEASPRTTALSTQRSTASTVRSRDIENQDSPSISRFSIVKTVICWDIREYHKIVKRHQIVKRKLKRAKTSDYEMSLEEGGPKSKPSRKTRANEALINEYRRATIAVEDLKTSAMSNLPCAGFAIIIFATMRDAALAADCWVDTFPSKLNRITRGIIQDGTPKFRGQYPLTVEKAPNPSDILWHNLGASLWSTMIWRCISYLAVILITGGGACALWYFIHWTIHIRETWEGNAVVSIILAALPPACISALNFTVHLIISYAADFEKHSSVTGRDISTMIQLTFCVLFNSSLIYLIINRDPSRWYIAGGLLENIFMQVTTDALFSPIITLMYPYTRLLRLRARMIDPETEEYTQNEYNCLCEGPEFFMPSKLAFTIRNFIITAIYLVIFPFGGVISFFGMVINYATEKYFLLRCCKRPYAQTGELIRRATQILPYLTALISGLSIILLKPHLTVHMYGMAYYLGIAGVAVALFVTIFIPLKMQTRWLFSFKTVKPPSDKRNVVSSYYRDQYGFVAKYHKCHPVYAALPADCNPEYLTETSGSEKLSKQREESNERQMKSCFANNFVDVLKKDIDTEYTAPQYLMRLNTVSEAHLRKTYFNQDLTGKA